MKFNGMVRLRVMVTQKATGEPDEFVIVRNAKASGGLIPYARYDDNWTTTVPNRVLIRELVLLLESTATEKSDFTYCKSCRQIAGLTEGFRCANCGEEICATCGCSDLSPCEPDCVWIRPGKCSGCEGDGNEV